MTTTHRRLHEALDNVTLADAYEGGGSRSWHGGHRSNRGHWHNENERIYTRRTERSTSQESLLQTRLIGLRWFDDVLVPADLEQPLPGCGVHWFGVFWKCLKRRKG